MEFIRENIFGNVVLMKIIGTLLILVLGAILIKISVKITRKILKKTSIDPVIHSFLLNLLKIVMWVILIFSVFGYLNLPLSSLITVSAVAGAAAALALQESLGNFAGGILILISRPFGKGDYIEDLEVSGIVEKIDLLYTTLATPDNRIITIPNGKIANSKIINYSRADIRRVDCKFKISYTADIARTKGVLRRVAGESPLILHDPPYVLGVSEHSDSAVILDFYVWCKTADYWETKYYLQETVKLTFDKEKIEIPYKHVRYMWEE